MGDSKDMVGAKLDQLSDQLACVEREIVRMAETMARVARLEVLLTNKSEAIKRAFDSIEKLHEQMAQHATASDARLKLLEDSRPARLLAFKWAPLSIAGVIGLLCGVVAAIVFW